MRNPEWLKKTLKKYNLTLEFYENMRKTQNFSCLICKNSEINNIHKCLDIDHCHVTGKVRGLLCNNCNSGIGFSKENIQTLEKAIEYLNKNK